jgi:hypothetical protein
VGFAQLLSIAIQNPGVAKKHIRALEVVGEDLLELITNIDDVSRHMVQPGSGRIC